MRFSLALINYQTPYLGIIIKFKDWDEYKTVNGNLIIFSPILHLNIDGKICSFFLLKKILFIFFSQKLGKTDKIINYSKYFTIKPQCDNQWKSAIFVHFCQLPSLNWTYFISSNNKMEFLCLALHECLPIVLYIHSNEHVHTYSSINSKYLLGNVCYLSKVNKCMLTFYHVTRLILKIQ